MNFPDKAYLENFIEQHSRFPATQDSRLLMLTGAGLNWVGDFMTDDSVRWTAEQLPVDDLHLTGTSPEWNEVVIVRAARSPQKLRALMQADPAVLNLFADARFSEIPILVHWHEGNFKVLDGMHRAIAAIREGRKTIAAFVARLGDAPRPHCEAHVVYDLLRAYQRGINTDRGGLVAALKFLKNSYANVEDLLRSRFSETYIPDPILQDIIREALT